MKPDVPPVPGAAEAAASVRFQPTPEDAHVCPACYHPPHVGMCAICLCFKAVPARDPQAGDIAVDSIKAAAEQPHVMADNLGQVFYPDNDEDAEYFAEQHGARPRHRREIARVSLLQRLRIWVSGG